MISKKEKQETLEDMKARGLQWWHKIDLGDGVITEGIKRTLPGEEFSKWKLDKVDFKNKLVLDIGAWDGLFSFYAEQRGASRVVSVDLWGDTSWGNKECYDFAHKCLNSKAESRECSVYDITREEFGTFDIVLFFGVLYHLRHPLLALDTIKNVCNEGCHLFLETIFTEGSAPMVEIFKNGYGGDKTNICSPTIDGLHSLLALSSFNMHPEPIIDGCSGNHGRVFCVSDLKQN